jgi:hypothetical protein
MIKVMMGDQYSCQFEALGLQGVDNRLGVTGINNKSPTGLFIYQQPKLVVVKSADWLDVKHRAAFQIGENTVVLAHQLQSDRPG